MDTVRARWGLDGVTVDDSDPFTSRAAPEAAAPVPAVAELPAVTDIPLLQDRLKSLLQEESELFNRGITCPIRDHQESTCSVCPASTSHGSLARLCAVGRLQERTLTELVIARQAQEGRRAVA